jgi:rubrerythrin
MLEIKTITHYASALFDQEVNEALEEGWELVRRECFITGSDRATTFYAELERIVDEPEEEEEDYSTDYAKWETVRDPRKPYRCSACGYKTNATWPICPSCDRIMTETEE